MNEDKNCGIYRILCIAEGKTNSDCYVGQAVNLIARKSKHFNDLRKNIHENGRLQNAYNKYGKEFFIFEILYYCNRNEEELTIWEEYYKEYYQAKYNIRPISKSNLGIKWSDEARKKMSISRKGKRMSDEAKKNMSISKKGNTNSKGKVKSDETLKKLSESGKGNTNRRGKKSSEESRKRQSEAQKGRIQSIETRNRISEKNKGKPSGMLGKNHSEETLKHMSENRPLGKSGYKGVYKRYNKWAVRIEYNKKLIYLGTFDNPEDAARAYDKKCIELYGHTRKLNNIDGIYS